MASATQLPGPMETSSSNKNAATPEQCVAQFELGITLSLFFWPSLSLAVTNQWGGPNSADKREWFASETISQLQQTSDADTEWIEEFLLQVMLDEFEVNVDDDSGFEVAEQMVRMRKDCARGEFAEVRALKEKWDSRGGKDIEELFKGVERGEEEDETDGSVDEDDDEDVEMDEAPRLVTVKEKAEPEVDEDGFTKITKKKR
ncbi:20S rRNA accumulation 2 [Hyphodiscus hymeniophilus]|uniref:20S rRNA accumulation 2 n=1 Tax=Hyphodiscus hymeniophilus TaxID=353542 RepID=A0A9P7AZ31_9HELO|nr:20S rRNA accumulation 2 [Hyphodiscus hymeniophilus]